MYLNIPPESQKQHPAQFGCLEYEPSNTKKRYYLGQQFHNNYLTKREIDCIHLLLRGQTAAGTGAILGLSRRTVESHLAQVY